jgi:signal peptidase I
MGVVLFIRFFIFNPFTVVGESMEPRFHDGDFIIVDKITPRLGKLERGDIIVFVPESRDVPFIKRIIGLPGEEVKIRDNNVLICS